MYIYLYIYIYIYMYMYIFQFQFHFFTLNLQIFDKTKSWGVDCDRAHLNPLTICVLK